MAARISLGSLWRPIVAAGASSLLLGTADGMPATTPEVAGAQQSFASAGPALEHCADGTSADAGPPVMFHLRGVLSMGVSTKPAPYGAPILVLLWIENPTDEDTGVAECSTIAEFWESGIDIYDSAGHRVIDREEEYLKEKGLYEEGISSLICQSQREIAIPAHRCIHGSFSSPEHDYSWNDWVLWTDLSFRYELPPGKYYIVERTWPRTPFDPRNGLAVTVEDWGAIDRLLHLSSLVSYAIRTTTRLAPHWAKSIGFHVPESRLGPRS